MNIKSNMAAYEGEPELAGLDTVIKLAVLAVGGQGGGVLSNWIAELAKKGNYDVQTTSVAGVAQRTGATIYYVEMAPKSGLKPVFAQSPSVGDLDVLIASELMEAGRAVMRGFITPDRTTLIASTHRIMAVSEKQMPGDGLADGKLVEAELAKAALKSVCFDMESIAVDAGTVISASLFGGLARSGALPFETSLYEDVIEASGRGVEQSLKAFRATLVYDEQATLPSKEKPEIVIAGPEHLMVEWNSLASKAAAFPPSCRSMVESGLQKVVDFQDTDYGQEYLDHLQTWLSADDEARDFQLTRTAAKYIANAMCYDDIIRVADLKTRPSRERRLRDEQQTDTEAIVHVTEYFHPRAEEFCSIMPVRIGKWFAKTPWALRIVDWLFNKGRRVRTDRITGFMMLRALCFMKSRRRKLLRHENERAHLERLEQAVEQALPNDYALTIEIFSCQRLIKGYSDTHTRGLSKFEKVLSALPMLEARVDAADWIRRLRELALKDEDGSGLEGGLKTIASISSSEATQGRQS